MWLSYCFNKRSRYVTISLRSLLLLFAFGHWTKSETSEIIPITPSANFSGRSWLGDHVSRVHVHLSGIGHFPFKFRNEVAKEKDGTTCHNQAYYCPKNKHIPAATCVVKYDALTCNHAIVPCKSYEFMCPKSRLCIPRYAVRDNNNDCLISHFSKTIDEKLPFTECFYNEFRCNNSGRCIPREWVLDGIPDCKTEQGVAMDEIFPLDECNFEEFRCRKRGRCIKRYHVMDDFTDCPDKSDEIEPLKFCYNETEFRCNGRCIPRSWMMDGVKNCEDGSDEQWREIDQCHNEEFKCHNGRRCLANIYLCDGIDHCGDCSDEIESCDQPAMIRCPHDPINTCVPFSMCSELNHCSSMQTFHPRSFKCKVNLNYDNCDIAQWMLGGDIPICYDQSDSCSTINSCPTCLGSSMRIAERQICDGTIDCPNLSDECLCITENNIFKQVCDQVCQDRQLCEIGEFICPLENKCLDLDQICNGKVNCVQSEIDEKYCNDLSKRMFINFFINIDPITADKPLRCDGVMIDYMQKICNRTFLTNIRTNDGEYIQQSCEGSNSENISLYENDVCNGFIKCHNEVDERFCPQRFRCTLSKSFGANAQVDNVFYIPMKHKCDGIIDCVNATDELNCSSSTHFYCHTKQPLFVPFNNVRNGKRDCEDNSDECSIESFELTLEPLSSPDEMIDNRFLRGLLWIMVAVSVFGNVIVVTEIISSFKSTKSMSIMRKCNQILIVNLATADFIMGIRLLIMAIKSTIMSGSYCSQEKQWRTSGLCDLIGVLVVISCKESVYTLVILTICRLYGVMRPFQSNHISFKKLMFSLLISWIFAIFVAIYPLIPRLNENLITHIYIEESPYFDTTSVPQEDMKVFAKWLFALNQTKSTPKELTSLKTLLDEIQSNFKDQSPKVLGYFGYYSTHGVCIPRFFRYNGNSQPLSPLSLVITGFTFFGILFIGASYVTIFYKSTLNRKLSKTAVNQDKKNAEMMKRVTILITTNFCCWFPICMMTFLSQIGVSIPPSAYAASAIVLLPINSCLNPVIYSNFFVDTRDKLTLVWKLHQSR